MLSAILPEAFYKWFRRFSAPLPEDINTFLTPETTCIDVGAGNGFFLSTITATQKKYAVEIWDKQIAYLRMHFPTVPVYSSIHAVDRKFDVVVCFDVLHHVENNEERERFIHKLFSIVAPGGTLLIKEMRDDLLLHKYVNRLSDYISTGSHTNEMNAQKLIDQLTRHGFSIERFERYTALLYGHYYIRARNHD